MTVTAHAPPRAEQAGALLERLSRERFPDAQFVARHNGGVEASVGGQVLGSSFQPVVRAADGTPVGQHAVLRVSRPDGAALAPWCVFEQATGGPQLVQIDRLCRTVHALNYFVRDAGAETLFLDVERRLLTTVRADHGAYFESILAEIGVPAGRVAIVLPREALEDPVTFVRAAISYRIRGYRVVAELRFDTQADLAHVFLAEPHYATFDSALFAPSAPEVRRSLEALARRGIEAISFARVGRPP